MKIHNITNIEKFFDAIERCTGRVDLICDDLCVNLKSEIAKYVAIAQIFSCDNIPPLEIKTYNQHDTNTLIMYLMDDRYIA